MKTLIVKEPISVRRPGLDITLRKAVAAVLATAAVYGGLAMIIYTGYRAVKYVLAVNAALAEWAIRNGL